MSRPAVDVVIPFLGPRSGLVELTDRLTRLQLGAGDTLTIVDNRPDASPATSREEPQVLSAPQLQTPGFARNRGAARGNAPWLLFLDADTSAPGDLLDRYFSQAPQPGTGLLAGEIVDETGAGRGETTDGREAPAGSGRRAEATRGRGEPAAARWARLTASMAQDTTLRPGPWSFAQTANCVVRREAFAAVGGFRDQLRACEDADLCYRLRAAGWEIERRAQACVGHTSRHSMRALLHQQLVHGAGIGWLEREYPGAAPPRRWPGFLLWGFRRAASGLASALRSRDRDAATVALIDPVVAWTRELGRMRSNTREPR